MKKVFQLLNLDEQTPGSYGIEIEAEGKNMNEVTNKFWRTEDDGSLRGHYPESRAEFVLKKPIELDQVEDAIKALHKDLPDAEFDFSFRTSVHVHMNAQGLTYVQLLNVIYLYLLLEEPLTTYCGKERKGNRFCLRLSDAEGILEVVNMLFRGEGEHLRHIPHDEIRYSAINLEALGKYGSLEFRAMRGNADKEVITTWVKALDALKQYAIAKESPMAIHQAFRDAGPSSFLKNVLGDVAGAFHYPRLIKDVQRSHSLSMDLPYMFVDAVKDREEAKKRQAEAPKRPKGKAVKFDFPAFLDGGINPVPVHPEMERVKELMRQALEQQQERQRNEDW